MSSSSIRRRHVSHRRQRRLVGATNRDAHPLVLDLDLADAALLHDLHQLADALAALGVGVLGHERRVAGVACPDHLEQLLGVRPEHRDEDELLLARGKTFGLLAHVLGRHRVVRKLRARREQLDCALDVRVDRLGRDAVAALYELAELVDHGPVPPRFEHVQERLRREDLTDRRGQRRPTRLGPDAADLLQHLEQAVRGSVRAQMHLERRDEACRQVVLRSAHGDPRRDGRDRLVTDVLVDEIGGLPELRDLEPRRVPEPVERLRDGLARDPVQRQRKRIHGRGHEIRPRLDGRERRRETYPRRALDVEPDRKLARLPDPRHELLGLVRDERARRVVHDHAGRTELGELARLLDDRVRLAGAARAVDEARVERAARARDRRARLAEVRHVVQRIVEPEDVDPVLGSAGDETADDVTRHRPRADEEASAERDPERRRHARLDRANPLPRALDPTPNRGIEDAAARDLEAREPGLVESLGHAQDFRRRDAARKRLLRQQSDRRIDQPRHGPGPYRPARAGEVARITLARCTDPRADRP